MYSEDEGEGGGFREEEEEEIEFDHGGVDYSPYSDDEEGKEEEDDIMDDFANAEIREAKLQDRLR